MIATIAITIFVESGVVVGYALLRKKPLIHILLSSILANLLTQSCLWVILNLFPFHYLSTLLIAEIGIVGVEGFIMYYYKYNQLKLAEAFLLSLTMNLASFTLGWFLPV